MKQKEKIVLRRAVAAQEAFRRLYDARVIHGIGRHEVVVPQRTLEIIEPDPSQWGYKRTQDGKEWWAWAFFEGVKFQALLSEEAHLDLGGYGIQ